MQTHVALASKSQSHPLTNMDWVSVRGGLGRHDLSMSAMAAVQLPWQSSKDDKMPPLRMPGKAEYLR